MPNEMLQRDSFQTEISFSKDLEDATVYPSFKKESARLRALLTFANNELRNSKDTYSQERHCRHFPSRAESTIITFHLVVITLEPDA